MSPPWLARITSNRDAEYIDAVQPGLVLRIRRGRMVWFVRYLFDGSARRYRVGQHPAVGLSAARKLASVVRGWAAAGDDPQAEKRAKREAPWATPRPKLLRTYMPTLPLGEARDALQKWGDEIVRILGADVGARGVELTRGADR